MTGHIAHKKRECVQRRHKMQMYYSLPRVSHRLCGRVKTLHFGRIIPGQWQIVSQNVLSVFTPISKNDFSSTHWKGCSLAYNLEFAYIYIYICTVKYLASHRRSVAGLNLNVKTIQTKGDYKLANQIFLYIPNWTVFEIFGPRKLKLFLN